LRRAVETLCSLPWCGICTNLKLFVLNYGFMWSNADTSAVSPASPVNMALSMIRCSDA
jgi:hypothetical protein